MKISTLSSDSTISAIRVGGRLDTVSSSELDEALRPFEEWTYNLIVDLTSCTYLSSTGIRVLLRTDKRLRNKGGGLYLAGLSKAVFQVLEIAGLHQSFHLFDTFKQAESTLRYNLSMKCPCQFWQVGDQSWKLQPFLPTNTPFMCWKNSGMVGYNELGFSIGFGQAAESPEEKPGLFLTIEHGAAFLLSEPPNTYDLRIVAQPEQAAVMVKSALSFGTRPSGWLIQEKAVTVTIEEVVKTIHEKCQEGLHSFIAISFDTSDPSITCGFIMDQLQFDRMRGDCACYTGTIELPNLGVAVCGARIDVNVLEKPNDPVALMEYLKTMVTYSNIMNIRQLSLDHRINDVQVWIFKAPEIIDAGTQRTSIQAPDSFFDNTNNDYLTRRLYPDALRLDIMPFIMGEAFSLYEVNSFDAEGRMLRPTILKLGDREAITREEERFTESVLPYISNNNVQVRDSALYNEIGALCYSLTGSGSSLKDIKPLSEIIKEGNLEVLEPLFDKVFLQMLEPWYGQPVEKSMHPFIDNDPTLKPIPQLIDRACEACGVSPDSATVEVEELGQRIVNPFWFLKYEYPARKETALSYHHSICHGNLNFESILLDRFMNVYLINFSETGLRPVISDFARMEVAFMVERAPIKTKEDLKGMIRLVRSFYDNDAFMVQSMPDLGKLDKSVMKSNLALIKKMRSYAQTYSKGTTTLMPYYMTLLEWALPLACEAGMSPLHKRLSMVLAGLLCEKVMALSER